MAQAAASSLDRTQGLPAWALKRWVGLGGVANCVRRGRRRGKPDVVTTYRNSAASSSPYASCTGRSWSEVSVAILLARSPAAGPGLDCRLSAEDGEGTGDDDCGTVRDGIADCVAVGKWRLDPGAPQVHLESGVNCSECPICLEEFKVGNMVRGLPCTHNFHMECIDQWVRLNVKCPRCRCSVFPNLDLRALNGVRSSEIFAARPPLGSISSYNWKHQKYIWRCYGSYNWKHHKYRWREEPFGKGFACL
ncbi:hypothetical protein ZWY2020_006728 [Hordeum vulgare]|nr:hypothetical protein ZWY2020_006728 [Hordeum vulgare]